MSVTQINNGERQDAITIDNPVFNANPNIDLASQLSALKYASPFADNAITVVGNTTISNVHNRVAIRCATSASIITFPAASTLQDGFTCVIANTAAITLSPGILVAGVSSSTIPLYPDDVLVVTNVDGEYFYSIYNQSSGSVITVTTNATLSQVHNNALLNINSTGARTVNLPSSLASKLTYTCTIRNINTGIVTIAGTVDGEVNPTLRKGESITIKTDGTSWFSVNPRCFANSSGDSANGELIQSVSGLPLIHKYGTASVNLSSGTPPFYDLVVTFATPFTSGCFAVIPIIEYANQNTFLTYITAKSTTGCTVRIVGNVLASNIPIKWVAMGF